MDIVLGTEDTPIYSGIGGSTGNVLAILSFLGWQSTPLTNMGRDSVGAAIFREFSQLSVDVSHIRLDRTLTSPLLYQFASARGEAPRYSFTCPVCSRVHKFSENLVDSGGDAFERCAAQSNVFFFDRATPVTVRMAAAARKAGALVFFEPSTAPLNKALFLQALKSAHVLKYSAERISEPFSDFLAWGFIEIQTLGAQGLRFRKHALAPVWANLPALPTRWVTDTSGAGDWCTAGFLHALFTHCGSAKPDDLSGNQIYRSLRLGQAFAALSVGHIGARGLMRAALPEVTLNNAYATLKEHRVQRPPERVMCSFPSACCQTLTSRITPHSKKPISF